MAELTFENRVCSKSGSSPSSRCTSRLRPVEEVEEVALGRSGVVVRKLAAVRAGDPLGPGERADECREPRLVGRERILAREDEDLAVGELGAEVARAAVTELRRRDLVHACPS